VPFEIKDFHELVLNKHRAEDQRQLDPLIGYEVDSPVVRLGLLNFSNVLRFNGKDYRFAVLVEHADHTIVEF
jgi:hypothetical protein